MRRDKERMTFGLKALLSIAPLLLFLAPSIAAEVTYKDYTEARSSYGGMLLDTGNVDEAIRQLIAVTRVDKSRPQTFYLLAEAYRRKDLNKDAVDAASWRRLMKYDKVDVDALKKFVVTNRNPLVTVTPQTIGGANEVGPSVAGGANVGLLAA